MAKVALVNQVYLNGQGKPQAKYVLAQNVVKLQPTNYNQNYYTITFDDDLVTDNVINMKVNGTSISPVTFAVSNANTLGLIATAITTASGAVRYAAATDTHVITVYPSNPTGVVGLTNIVVTAGASQAVATVSTPASVELTGAVVNMKFGTGSTQDTMIASDSSNTIQSLLNTALATDVDVNVLYDTFVTNGVSETKSVPVNAMYWFYANASDDNYTDILWFDALRVEWSISTVEWTASNLASFINGND